LCQNVPRQVRLIIEVLHERKRIGKAAPLEMTTKDLGRRVAAELAAHVCAEQALPQFVPKNRDADPIRFGGIARERLERGLAAENARGPVELGINAAQR